MLQIQKSLIVTSHNLIIIFDDQFVKEPGYETVNKPFTNPWDASIFSPRNIEFFFP